MFINILTLNTINKLGIRPSFLAQKVIQDFLNNKSAQRSANIDNVDEFDDSVTNKLFDLLFTNIEANSWIYKPKKQTFKTNAPKRQKFYPKIFDFIYIAKCCQFFSLSLYND